jgi:hypothetical protein
LATKLNVTPEFVIAALPINDEFVDAIYGDTSVLVKALGNCTVTIVPTSDVVKSLLKHNEEHLSG